MINHWFVTRPKRKLTSVPEILSLVVSDLLGQEWEGQRDTHLYVENALEKCGLKRKGDRRDQTGGGARTYIAWLKSLGLLFDYKGKMFLTLAGEALVDSQAPVPILTNQILKFQYPSPYSLRQNVQIHQRFRIRPFRFLLKILLEDRLECYLTEEEIACVVLTEAENETDSCYDKVVEGILRFREKGWENFITEEFVAKYLTSRPGEQAEKRLFNRLLDVANTFVNWLDYTRLIDRNYDGKKIRIVPEKVESVEEILSVTPPFIGRPENEEFFQRKYGLDPNHLKDTRNLSKSLNVTEKIVLEQKIKTAFIAESLKAPICKISLNLIERIAEICGCEYKFVEEFLSKYYPHGAINTFLTNYYEMAFKGTRFATEFEIATASLFSEVFGMQAEHVGPIGLTPDVLVISNEEGFQGIIDNKAIKKYSISNDHYNRMVTNYLGGIHTYSDSKYPVAFFSYIAGGFSDNIEKQLLRIKDETGISGSAMPVRNMIELVERNEKSPVSHEEIRKIFGLNREVLLSDIYDYNQVESIEYFNVAEHKE